MNNAEMIDKVRRRASDASFGQPLIQNSLRGIVTEAIVSLALPPEWTWCGADWGSWDFEHVDRTRLEVKQSAARQTWDLGASPFRRSFDIASRQGRWEGPAWVDEVGRNAHIYVFAYHPIVDETADHRDPSQWQFYAVCTEKLPDTKRASLSWVLKYIPPSSFDQLASNVETLRLGCARDANGVTIHRRANEQGGTAAITA